jgi:histidinol-phosphatase (PHP family)
MTWMDYHLHTRDSVDSSETMRRICRRAVELGLSEICFTEHYDIDPYDPGYNHYDDARYERRLAAVRREFDGRLVIRKGLEFDYQSRYADRLAERLAPYEFDYVIGSVHNVFGIIVSRAMTDRGFPPDAIYRMYFDETRSLIATGLLDCLGHLDYVRKLLWRELADYRYADYEAEMADIVRRLVASDIGLEVNSRYWGPGGQPAVPGADVLRMYFEAGGRRMTLGSDAHRASGVAAGFAESVATLREVGFTEIISFDRRRATVRPLPDAGDGLASGPVAT